MSETLNKYYYDGQGYLNFYNLHKSIYETKKFNSVMLSEKVTLCEINASLWIKAITSATNSITKHTYSHYVIVQKFINYFLNTDSTDNFGLIENYFWKLLLTHPPSAEMFDYYWQILSDNFVSLNNGITGDQNIFFFLIEAITNCLRSEQNTNRNNDITKPAKKFKSSFNKVKNITDLDSKVKSLELKKSINISSNKSSEVEFNDKQICFEKLPWNEKVRRCLTVLNFVYNILETDFISWLHSNEFMQSIGSTRPLVSYLLWKNPQDFGLINKEVETLFYLYKLSINLDFQNIHVINMMISLIGEVIRCSESREEIIYPFVGKNSVNFSRELSIILHQNLIESQGNAKKHKLIVSFKPPWLRLFVCSNLLTLITKHQCRPELTGIYDILEYIENKNQNNRSILSTSSSDTNISTQKRKFKNVNSMLKNGKTHLHVACENNDAEKVRMLLTFPELEVNAIDQNGWTALHIAACKGKIANVQELLLFTPKPGGTQKLANTRAQGPGGMTPLMCAASQGHAEICNLLLEHSGPVLLEDVNELKQTPFKLSNGPEVKKILRHYKRKSMTQNSYKNINFDLELENIVIKLCVEMIQAYFSTYRSCNISKIFKQTVKENLNLHDVELKWNFKNHDKNIKKHIYKLKSLLSNLESIKEFKSLSVICDKMLSFKKIC